MANRILIVDDDRSSRILLQRLLEKDGFEVLVCSEAREALQLIDSLDVSLIVSDYEMPEFNGAQLCEMVRQRQDDKASLPFILLTAHSGEMHEVESLESGANDFVSKPVNPAVLKARIDTHLRLHALRRELEVWRQNHELDLEAARITQRAILPGRIPQIAGWQVAAHYQPVIQVGGDMYDWLKLSDGHWLLWIADATGHGASAALLTSLTKLIFRHASGEISTPGEILREVNAEFYAIFRGKSFMTAACLVLHPGTGRLRFSGAGHPPLMIVSGEKATRQSIASQCPPLGIVGQLDCGEAEVELAPTDVALLYTDGLYAALDGQAGRGMPADLEPILPLQTASAEDFIRQTLQAAGAGESISDDLAIVAVRREATAG